MTVRELYHLLNEKIPPSLSCEWDNDGLMCCPDGDRQVRRVLIALDVTDRVVRAAVEGGYDLIVSHHPLMFRGLKTVDEENFIAAKTIDLIREGISVMCFHTRLDALEGGVNDVLAELLGLENVRPMMGKDGPIGRVGEIEETDLQSFAEEVKQILGAPFVLVADAGRRVRAVAVLGGNGDDEIEAARQAGADTYISGRLGYHNMTDAPEQGINLMEAGHYYTENPVCEMLQELLYELDDSLICDVMESGNIRAI